MACFHCIVIAVMVLLTLYWFQRDISSLVYSSLPDEYKTRLWYTLCLLQEANQMLYCTFSATFIFQLHLLLPGTLARVLKNLANSARCCRGSPAEIKNVVEQIHVIQLVVNLFNVGHRNVTYCIKLLFITGSIVNGYGAIAHGGEDFVFLLLSSAIGCELAFLYAFLCEKAFAIPEGLEDVKRELSLAIQSTKNAALKTVVHKELKSTPSFGIKVGEFHMLERESTPIFVDNVLRNIVNLLVTF